VLFKGNKDSNPWLWDSNLLALPQNSQKDSNLRIPIRGFVSPLSPIRYSKFSVGSSAEKSCSDERESFAL
jgi:hypothetical protein